MIDTKFWKQVCVNFANVTKPFTILGLILLSEWLLYEYVLFGLSKPVLIAIYTIGNMAIIFFVLAYDEAKPKNYDSIPDDG